MGLRDGWRKVRLFYKSIPLFRRVLRNPFKALMLPLTGQANFSARNGIVFQIPPGKWELLPTMCRLAEIGAIPSFEAGRKKVLLNDLCLYSPENGKDEGVFYREVFIDDVYKLDSVEVNGNVVVDIGSFIGDVAIALAKRGATVHAFEPSKNCNGFIDANIAANGLTGLILPARVGLSNSARTESSEDDELVFVEAIEYVLANLPGDIAMLKLDCEGCEYYLLDDPRFLGHLRPEYIALEYHHGGEEIQAQLEQAGYRVSWPARTAPVGMMYGFLEKSTALRQPA